MCGCFLILSAVFEQAQQLFQIHAQKITLEALESVKAALASNEIEHKAKTKKRVVPRNEVEIELFFVFIFFVLFFLFLFLFLFFVLCVSIQFYRLYSVLLVEAIGLAW